VAVKNAGALIRRMSRTSRPRPNMTAAIASGGDRPTHADPDAELAGSHSDWTAATSMNTKPADPTIGPTPTMRKPLTDCVT